MFIASLPSGLWGCCEQIFWLAYYLLPLLPLLLYLNYKRFCFSCLFIYKISYISPWELCYLSIEQNSSRWQPLLLLLQLCNFLVPYSTIQLSSYPAIFWQYVSVSVNCWKLLNNKLTQQPWETEIWTVVSTFLSIPICCGTIPTLSKYLKLFQKEQASRNLCPQFDELNANFLIRETEYVEQEQLLRIFCLFKLSLRKLFSITGPLIYYVLPLHNLNLARCAERRESTVPTITTKNRHNVKSLWWRS